MLNTRQIRNSFRNIAITRISSASALPLSCYTTAVSNSRKNTKLSDRYSVELVQHVAYTTFLRHRDLTSIPFFSPSGKRNFSSASARSTPFASFSPSPVVRTWEERSAADAAAHSEYLLSQLASFDNLLHLPDNQLDLPLFTQELAIDDLPSNPEPTEALKASVYATLPVDLILEFSPADEAAMDAAATSPITSFTPRQLFQFGHKADTRNLISSAKFLHTELAIRFAQLAVFARSLPTRTGSTLLLRGLYHHYATNFLLFHRFPTPETESDAVEFTALTHLALRRSNRINSTFASYVICRGMLGRNGPAGTGTPTGTSAPLVGTGAVMADISPAIGDLLRVMESPGEMFVVQEALDNFHISRIETRLLLAQHAALYEALRTPRKNYAGLIAVSCVPADVARRAFKRALVRVLAKLEPSIHGRESFESVEKMIYERMHVPELNLVGETEFSLRFLQSHLEFILTELLTNSIAALAERYPKKGEVGEQKPPAIEVTIAKSAQDFMIRISDRGGGIPRALLEPIWTYTYSMNKWIMQPLTRKLMVVEELANQRQELHLRRLEQEGVVRYEAHSNSRYDHDPEEKEEKEEPPIPTHTLPEGWPRNINANHSWTFEKIANAPEATGVGLPKARLMARYFGGDILIMSLHGYGLDAYVTLSKEGIVTPQDVEMESNTVNIIPAEHTL